MTIQPGVQSIVSGLAVLLLPVWWRLRLRGASMAYHNLTVVRWLVRGLGSLFFAVGLVQATAADPHEQLRAAPILVGGMSGLFFANVLARLVIGPSVMTLEPARLRQYWWATTKVGVVWIGVGLVLLYAWQHVR